MASCNLVSVPIRKKSEHLPPTYLTQHIQYLSGDETVQTYILKHSPKEVRQPSLNIYNLFGIFPPRRLKADSHMPRHSAKALDCLSPICFTQRGRV
jgi:hypothetical protein